ncbi:alpha/beta fold hydrolase [Streptomyces sp. TRM43335]|uniref:Alpha/beta fold hydrolase n=1 Tax=Streptomyces taklimakanensis TaxID=2569853 RepID=A0A6G2BBE7_9ACTN|nr:alpha/beta fold hydrolase [Streptomyces taklimakanensis]MTE19601.1 alpha/beta fold hydrolase [Streptomyces taklimakanensis]
MSSHPLFLLHHSGGSAQVFSEVVRTLPSSVEPLPLELPGRGRRWREEPVTTAQDAVDDLAGQVARSGVRGGFAILGHSMGAYLGLALAARLERVAGEAWCELLFASANAGPYHAVPLFEGDPLEADDERILATASRFGGIAPQVLAHEELRARTARLLRADFAVCDSFVRTYGRTVVENPIVVCCGTKDAFTEAQLENWRLSTVADAEVVRIPGDHFYLDEQAEKLAETVAARLAPVGRPVGPVRPPAADDRGARAR